MKVAHISIAVGPPVVSKIGGGIQRRILELARAQAAAGHQVTVYSRGEPVPFQDVDGVNIVDVVAAMPLPFRHLQFPKQALKALRGDGGADVMHFHSQPEAALVERSLPGVRALAYDFFEFRRGKATPLFPLYRKMLHSFDLLLPCSDYCRDESAAYWSLPEKTVHTLYNGVNTLQFRPMPEQGRAVRDRLGIEGPVVLYVGRLCHQKGSDILIDAIASVRKSRPDVTLVMAGPVAEFGSSSSGEEWRQQVERVGGRYLGVVPEDELPAVFNMATVFVMPTRSLEMFGMAAVEAQACGVPTIASDHGGLPETVPSEVGARFPVGDSEALASAILDLISDKARLDAAGAAALRNASRFAWEVIASEAHRLYRDSGA